MDIFIRKKWLVAILCLGISGCAGLGQDDSEVTPESPQTITADQNLPVLEENSRGKQVTQPPSQVPIAGPAEHPVSSTAQTSTRENMPSNPSKATAVAEKSFNPASLIPVWDPNKKEIPPQPKPVVPVVPEAKKPVAQIPPKPVVAKPALPQGPITTALVPKTPVQKTEPKPVVAQTNPVKAALAEDQKTVAERKPEPPKEPLIVLTPVPPEGKVNPKALKAESVRTRPVQQERPVSQQPVANTEQSAYKAALSAYQSKRFDESEQRFDAFMHDYPHSKLVANALYWKGEILYARGKYADSIFLFKDVVAKYPKHTKAPDALLKSGMAYTKMHDEDNAQLHYQVLKEDYPTSPAAKRGKSLGLFK